VAVQQGDGVILKVEAERAGWRASAAAVAPLVALVCWSGAALAQSGPYFPGGLDPLFERDLAQPSDLNNTIQYAATASANDVETAIGAYEQLLFYNPQSARVRYELGILYFRLGAYEMARGYLKTALQMPDLSPDLAQRAGDLLAVADKKLQVDQFSGFAQAGVAYQSNPGGGAGSQTRLASGNLLNSRFAASPDWNGFGGFALNYVHDFQNQRGDAFEASAIGYDAQEFRLHQFDIGVMEIRAGPRFGILPASEGGLSVKPYAIATGSILADAPFYGGYGGGVTVHAGVGAISLDPYAEIVQQSYRSSTLYPLASGLTGTISTYGLQASGPLASNLGWQTRTAFAHASDQFSPYSYDSYIADVWLPWNFSFPGDGRVWTITPSGGFTRWLYNAPDPNVDPVKTPRTTEWRASVALDVPVWRAVTLGVLVQYRADTSNIAAFSTHDLLVSAGPTFRF
jgi:hypothetical protein